MRETTYNVIHDNASFIRAAEQERRTLEKQQDELLDTIGGGADRLLELGLMINAETKKQSGLIDQLGNKVAHDNNQIQSVNDKLSVFTKKVASQCNTFWVLVVLIVIVVILLFLILFT